MASAGLAPRACRKTITSRMARCSRQARANEARLLSPRPSTSRRRCGSSSRTRSASSPKAATTRCASFGPTPLMSPEARYFSSPASVSGASSMRDATRSCSPCFGSTSRRPRTRTRAPSAIGGNVPTTASRSLRPATASFTTRKLDSALSNVMRQTTPSTTVSVLTARGDPSRRADFELLPKAPARVVLRLVRPGLLRVALLESSIRSRPCPFSLR